jgi:hypothetical protein
MRVPDGTGSGGHMTVDPALLRRANSLRRQIAVLEAQLATLRVEPAYVQAVRRQAVADAYQLLEADGSRVSRVEYGRLVTAVMLVSDPIDAALLLQEHAGVFETNNELLRCGAAQRSTHRP